MRLAYDNYRDASETLDAVVSRGPIAISLQDRICGIESLAAKQRIEFETYIEKRLQYAEFVRDRDNPTGKHGSFQRAAGHSNQRQVGHRLWLGSVASKIAVGAALLCIAIFIAREQSRAHSMDVAHDETSATLNHAPGDQPSLARQLSASGTPADIGAPTKVAGKHESPVPTTKSEGRAHYWFTLKPSTQFKQVGTVRLSLRKDPKQRNFDLRVIAENSKIEIKHVKLEAPVWIDAPDRFQSVAVVLTRIRKNEVRGYISEPGKRKLEAAIVPKIVESARFLRDSIPPQ